MTEHIAQLGIGQSALPHVLQRIPYAFKTL